MHTPTIYKENIESHPEYVDLSDDKLHHLIKVLRIANNSPVKISTWRRDSIYRNNGKK